jgi:hypothetical protein
MKGRGEMYVRAGMSLAKQWSKEKGVRHYAIIDWEDGLRLRGGWIPVVIEMKPSGPDVRYFQANEQWTLTQIQDARSARRRLLELLRSPERLRYDAVVNNCEHVAHFVAFGEFRSEQVRGFLALAGLGVALMLVARRAA